MSWLFAVIAWWVATITYGLELMALVPRPITPVEMLAAAPLFLIPTVLVTMIICRPILRRLQRRSNSLGVAWVGSLSGAIVAVLGYPMALYPLGFGYGFTWRGFVHDLWSSGALWLLPPLFVAGAVFGTSAWLNIQQSSQTH